MVPVLQRSLERKTQVLYASPLTELKTGSPDHIDLTAFLSRFESEEMAEQIEMRVNAKEGFAKGGRRWRYEG